MDDYVKVAKTSELAPGEKKLVEVGGRPVALFNIESDFYAIEDVCTHDGGPLAEGDVFGEEIECPRHGARFNVKTGVATRMPAFEPVESYEVKVEGEDILIRAD